MPQTLRSLLFVPADDERKMRRAVESGADLVIFDLEDAVATPRKAEAREILAKLVAELRPPRFAIRVNSQDTEHHLDDLLVAARLAPDFLMLPKCASVDRSCAAQCTASGARTGERPFSRTNSTFAAGDRNRRSRRRT